MVDPGPADEGHLRRVLAAADSTVAGIVVTHSHPDHCEGAEALAELAGGVAVVVPGAGGADGPRQVGPFTVEWTPGHARDHVCLFLGDICLCGDLVAGRGSVIVPPEPGALAAYIRSLETVRRRAPRVLCPGHGPPVWDPIAKIDEYLNHRRERERLLLAALDAGVRDKQGLLDRAWFDVPPPLRGLAAVNLASHLDKLAGEGRLPADLDPTTLGIAWHDASGGVGG